MWDIGANVGLYTLVASRAVGPKGKVLAFEPDVRNRERLEAALRRNGAENVVVHPFAFSDAIGQIDFAIGFGGQSHIAEAKDMAVAAQVVTVPALTLDAAAERFGIPDLIKIDVEGAETTVLQGGQKFLSDHSPTMIIEFHGEERLREGRGLLPGYRFTQLEGSAWLVQPAATGCT